MISKYEPDTARSLDLFWSSCWRFVLGSHNPQPPQIQSVTPNSGQSEQGRRENAERECAPRTETVEIAARAKTIARLLETTDPRLSVLNTKRACFGVEGKLNDQAPWCSISRYVSELTVCRGRRCFPRNTALTPASYSYASA